MAATGSNKKVKLENLWQALSNIYLVIGKDVISGTSLNMPAGYVTGTSLSLVEGWVADQIGWREISGVSMDLGYREISGATVDVPAGYISGVSVSGPFVAGYIADQIGEREVSGVSLDIPVRFLSAVSTDFFPGAISGVSVDLAEKSISGVSVDFSGVTPQFDAAVISGVSLEYNVRVDSIPFFFDSGSTVESGDSCFTVIPYGCSLIGVDLVVMGGISGATVQLYRDASGLPDIAAANSILVGSGVSCQDQGGVINSVSLSGTTSLSSGDVLLAYIVDVTSGETPYWVSFSSRVLLD